MRILPVIFALLLLLGCDDSWDHYAKRLTTKEPASKDIVGSYTLTSQTIIANDMAFLHGQVCRLELQTDGSFTVTNYPVWTNSQLLGLISTDGRWQCSTVGIVDGDQDVWGIRFSDTDNIIDLLSFMGKAAPYDLMMTYGDGDENKVMIFKKDK